MTVLHIYSGAPNRTIVTLKIKDNVKNQFEKNLQLIKSIPETHFSKDGGGLVSNLE